MTDPSPLSRRRRSSAWFWWSAAILAGSVAVGWWMLDRPVRPERRFPPAAAGPTPAGAPTRTWRPRPVVEPAPGCAPEADRRCVEGDAWWVDGCGVTYAKAQECGARLCEAGRCEPPPPPGCGGIPPLGRCEGDVARGCAAGYPFEVDCAALGRRCALTDEGPVCRPADPPPCDPRDQPPRCEGDTLRVCVEGEVRRTDCRAHAAICGRPPAGGPASCVQLRPPVRPDDCDDACGCPPTADDEEVCDGLDNDGDGWIDEAVECEPVDLVFFVIGDANARGSYAREDIDQEFARMQRALARDDEHGVELRLADVVLLPQPDWLEFDGDDLDALVRSDAVMGRRERFYVPVVLTDRVWVDEAPRPGLSTVPNGVCGGQRRLAGPQPVLGAIVLAKHRWETTGAHELGHFFGLCHTHADHPPPIVRLDPGDPDDPDDDRACEEPCVHDGDGICDTPVDPGPGPCALGPECALRCDDGSRPDPSNLMGYYPACRTGFSLLQAQLMRRTIALRRGWYDCRYGGGCPCEIGGGSCPEGMSCRRFEGDAGPSTRCALDGPVVPGGVCVGPLDCSEGSQCVGQPDAEPRCVRPCTDLTPDCRCAEVGGVTHPICVNDLQRDGA